MTMKLERIKELAQTGLALKEIKFEWNEVEGKLILTDSYAFRYLKKPWANCGKSS